MGIIKLKTLIPLLLLFSILSTSIYASTINVILTSPTTGSGFVELKSTVTYNGEKDVKCIYEYSSNGVDYNLINETLDKNSDYSVYWQTSNVPNGQYVIKVTATDTEIMHTHTRLMDVNNTSSSPTNPDSYWDQAFGYLKYKSQASFMHYGVRSELKITYGNMPKLVKDYLAIDTQYTTDSGGMTRVILTSKEIPSDLIEKENFIGQVYTIELSMGGNIMSVSYDLSDVKSSGTEAFSNTFDQRLKLLENKVTALENSLKTSQSDNPDLSKFVTVAELNSAIKGLQTEMGNTPPDATVNQIKDLNQSLVNLSRNYQTLSNGIKNITDTTVKKDDIFYKYSMYLGAIALVLAIFSFVLAFSKNGISNSNKGIPKPKPVIPSTPRERKQNQDQTVKNIDYIQRGYFK